MNTRQLKKFKIDDDTVVDAVKNLVYRDGEEIPVSPKGIQILLFLIAKNGELATYQEFETELWHGYNSQTSLYQQIASLRRCLGDSSTRPKYIKTVSKQGYAFVGRCEPLEARESASKDRKAVARVALIAVSVACLVGVLTFVGLRGSGSEAESGARSQDSILSTGSDAVLDIALDNASDHDPKSQLFIKAFVDNVNLPKAVIGLQLPPDVDDKSLLSLHNALHLTTKFHLNMQQDYHVAILPAATVRDDWETLQRHFDTIGGLLFVIEPFVEQRGDGVSFGFRKKDGQTQIKEIVVSEQTGSIETLGLDKYESRLMRFLQQESQEFILDSEAQFSATSDGREFSSIVNFPLNEFIPADVFESFFNKFLQIHKNSPENLVLISSALDIIFATLDQQNVYNTSPVISALKNLADVSERSMPGYFKTYHARAEYYCRILNYEKCKPELVKAYKLKPFDFGVIGNVRFYLIESKIPTLQLDKINHIANPFAAGAYSFYRNSLLQKLSLSEAEQLASDFSQWDANHDNWYLIAQTQTDKDDLSRFNHWYKNELGNSNHNKISKYNAYMLLNANHHREARLLYADGLEEQPYFDLLILDLMADIWAQKADIQKWEKLKQKAEDRREFQNALDKLYLAYFDMYFDNKRSARKYIEEIFPELTSDDIVITQDNFRYAVYFNESIKEIGDHRRSLSLDYALVNFLNANPDLQRNASFGLADVEFYALTGREALAAERLQRAVLDEGWMPNAFWMWPPLEANRFFSAIHSTDGYQKSVSYLQDVYLELCNGEC